VQSIGDYFATYSSSYMGVRELIIGDRLELTAGIELVNADLSAGEDLSDDLMGGRVSRSMNARIHGTCSLQLARELPWGASLVRPYLVLADRGVSARFNLGVFSLTTPEKPLGPSPVIYSVDGFDRLYLLDREVGDTYEVAAGTAYTTAIADVIADAGLSGVIVDNSMAAKTLPQTMVWPLVPTSGNPATWLRIVNDLAAAINYRGLWVDELGRFRADPYVNPADRAPEWVFDVDVITTIVGEDRTVTEDLWKAPNRWIFVQQNRSIAPTVGDGIYIVDNEHDGPTSQDQRGVWPRQVKVDVADHASLVAFGDRVVAADRRVSLAVNVTTGPFPVAGHADVYTYSDTAAGGSMKVTAEEWDLDLLSGAMRWRWQEVAA
jgi:hypothetical protein